MLMSNAVGSKIGRFLPSSTGWIWAERDALHGDRDLDEVAGLGLEVRQPVEAADLPERAGSARRSCATA